MRASRGHGVGVRRTQIARVVALLCVAVLSVVGATAVTSSQAAEPFVVQDLSFTASDGVKLHAYIGGTGSITKRPLILEDTPYGEGCCNAFAGSAYNYIKMHWRGTGRSGGELTTTGERDQKDLSEFLGWACTQPWSDGRIGIYGFSASAIVTYNSMHLPLPCVKGAALMAGSVDLYRDLLYKGGTAAWVAGFAVLAGIFAPWMQNLQSRLPNDPASLPSSLMGFATVVPKIALHQTEDDFWRDRTFKGDRNKIPLLIDTSFYDVEPRGPFEAFKATKANGSHLIVMGAHDGFPAGTPGPFPQYARWMDHFVRGIDNGIDRDPVVTAYLGNGSRQELKAGHFTKLTGNDWPLPGTRWTSLYLSPERTGTAQSLNDGSLARLKPKASSRQVYPFLPSNAFATDQHTISTIGDSGVDQAASYFPALTDMSLSEPLGLTYTTPPLTAPLDVTGPLSLELYAASTAPATDLLGVVTDVWPDGSSHPVASGMLRTLFPRIDRSKSLIMPGGEVVAPYADFSQKREAPTGATRRYDVGFLPIGNHFGAGHRIRVAIVGTPFVSVPTLPGLNTVSLGGLTPSRLLLPSVGSTPAF